MGFPRTPFLTVAENLSLYRQPQAGNIAVPCFSMLLFALGRFDDKLGAQGIAQLAAIQYQMVVMAVAPLFAGIVVVIGMTAVVLFGNDF